MYLLYAEVSKDFQIDWSDIRRLASNSGTQGLSVEIIATVGEFKVLAGQILEKSLRKSGVNWLYQKSGRWYFNAGEFRKHFDIVKNEQWLEGLALLHLEISDRKGFSSYFMERQVVINFLITPEIVERQMTRKIFLSHKGIDKPLVRRFELCLRSVGLQPWLDENDMLAGAYLEREILKGFEESCAAIFFVTPEFKDQSYLASEINYAVEQKRVKGDKFSIITLVFSNSVGKKGIVPDLLKSYLWKEPDNELSAFSDIIKALPINIGEHGWKR